MDQLFNQERRLILRHLGLEFHSMGYIFFDRILVQRLGGVGARKIFLILTCL